MPHTSNLNFPPGPDGNGWWDAYAQNPLDFLMESSRTYGDLVHFSLGTKRHLYLVTRPDCIRYVLIDHPEQFNRGMLFKRRTKRLLGNGLLTNEGDLNKRQRRLVQPAFHHSRIACYAEVMVAETLKMLSQWQPETVIDLHAEMIKVTMSVVAETLLGANMRSDPERSLISKAINESFDYFNSEELPEPTEAIATADDIIGQIINERRISGQDTGDLLSMLLLAAEDNEGMSDKQVRDEVMTIFIAGHETSANTLTWAFYLLSQNPDVHAKLLHELDTVLNGRTPTMHDLSQLPYVDMVIKETLRLYSPAWNQTREVLDDVEFGDYTIPKGSTIIISSFISHRDPRYFDDPECFRPERFAAGYDRNVYFPFSMGPRVCIGQPFAQMEMALILATVAARYRFEVIPDWVVEIQPYIALRPKGGLPVKVFFSE